MLGIHGTATKRHVNYCCLMSEEIIGSLCDRFVDCIDFLCLFSSGAVNYLELFDGVIRLSEFWRFTTLIQIFEYIVK